MRKLIVKLIPLFLLVMITASAFSGYCFGRDAGDKPVQAFASNESAITIQEAIDVSRSAARTHLTMAELIESGDDIDTAVVGDAEFHRYWARLHSTCADLIEEATR